MASLLLRIAATSLCLHWPPSIPKSSNPDVSGILQRLMVRPCARAARQEVWWNMAAKPHVRQLVARSLRVYHAVYELIAPFFPVLESSTSDAENRQTIDSMRARIRGLLSGDPTFDAVGRRGGYWYGYDDQSMQSAMLGFCACVCFLRHRYRWGVSPVVHEAQIETSLALPPELDEPWLLLQRYFGFTSPGGGLSTCPYFNTRGVDTNFKPFYSSVHGLPQLHQKTADWDARLFLETEYRASRILTPLHPGLTVDQSLPMYRLIAETISACGSFAGDCPLEALTSLKEANSIFQNTSRFFGNMKDANISHSLWLAYLQGYTGWALPDAGGVIVSGVSGGHSLTIRTLDASLGILPAPPAVEEALHLPVHNEIDAPELTATAYWQEVQDELQKMVQNLRVRLVDSKSIALMIALALTHGTHDSYGTLRRGPQARASLRDRGKVHATRKRGV
ncbi:hypothetical protein B0H13DRAFT_2291980 [Mycena leptocephala]|nr:hypothetical protein B0H13DRAFT_2291980 [Mycena leptocephala]